MSTAGPVWKYEQRISRAVDLCKASKLVTKVFQEDGGCVNGIIKAETKNAARHGKMKHSKV